jgi:hypothetical protein
LHYCGGKIKTVTFVGFQEQKSCCKGKAMKKGCCKDVKLALKKTSEDQKQAIATPFFAPPPQAFPPVFIKNCVFII